VTTPVRVRRWRVHSNRSVIPQRSELDLLPRSLERAGWGPRSPSRSIGPVDAAGLLLLAHTGRIRMFGASASELMARYIDDRIKGLAGK
jgi:hypothetical protein